METCASAEKQLYTNSDFYFAHYAAHQMTLSHPMSTGEISPCIIEKKNIPPFLYRVLFLQIPFFFAFISWHICSTYHDTIAI